MFPVDSGDIAFVGMVITFCAFLWQVVRERNKPHVDMSEAAQNLIGPYRDEVNSLRARVEALEQSEIKKDKLIAELTSQIKELQRENADKDRVILSLRVELDKMRKRGTGWLTRD